jgi:hypothetical protein
VLDSCVTRSACAVFAVRYTFLSTSVSDWIEMPPKCVNSASNFCYVCVEKAHLCQGSVLYPK